MSVAMSFLFMILFLVYIPASLYFIRRYCGYDAYTVLRSLYILLFFFCLFVLYYFLILNK